MHCDANGTKYDGQNNHSKEALKSRKYNLPDYCVRSRLRQRSRYSLQLQLVHCFCKRTESTEQDRKRTSMNDKPRPQYLTKSRFKLGLECPTKLFYTNKREYANNQNENSFLKALAAGGYQVGELAKLYYPEGVDVTTLDSAVAIEQTQALLESDQACLLYTSPSPRDATLSRMPSSA